MNNKVVQQDLRLEISTKHILALALPISASILVPQINYFTNNIFLGKLGEAELGAAGITGVYYLIFGKVPVDKTHGVGNDKLMEKWSKLFTTKDFASVLYTQICTKACKDEKIVRDNLTGEINTESCALTIAMKLSNGVLKNEHLDTAFKKYYISYFSDNIVNKTNTIQENLNAMINVLLAKNLTNNPDDYKVPNNDITTKIGLLFSAMNNYYAIKGVLPYNSINETNAQIEISNQKNDLIKLIMSEINKMDIKPLEFDILQIITFILNDFKDDDAKLFNLDSSTYTNLFPIIPDEDKYSDETKNNYINKLIHIIKQRQTTLLIPYIYHLLEILNCGIVCNYEKHSLYKLNESRHLGLYYKGLIPYLQSISNITLHDNHPIAKKEIKLLLNPKSWNLLNDKIDKGDIPIIGNYIDSGSIAAPKKLNINEKLNYYSYTIVKCRPPLEESIKILGLRNKNNLITILSKITSNKDSDNSLINLIDSNSRLAKVFTDIYSPIMILGELIDFEDEKTKINKLIDDIIMNVNKYNSYILLYYYLMNKDKLIKLPKFNYYEIPKIGKTGKFLYFDDDNNNLNLNRFDSSNVPDSPESDIPKNINSSVIYHKGVPLFRRLIRNLNDNFFKDKYIIKKESLVRSKNVGLPPSIASILEEFYKYNLILLLKEQFDDFLANANNSILADVKEIKDEFDITNNDVLTYFTIGKIIEELISEHSKDYIQKQSFRIVTKLLKKIDTENPSQFPNFSTSSMIVKSDDFSLMLNNTNLPDSITKINITDLNLFNLYQFSKEENIVDNNIIFIIYPDEYANSELLTSKYKLTLNREIYKKLLESNINPYLLDLNNQSAVFPILKVHNYSIVKELKTFIDYREYSDVNALDFLIEEYNNHYTLITNKENDFNKWLSNFVIYQKNEVKTLILSNDKFGNNVPNYLEDSFEIVLYLTSQYLSESINKMPTNLQTKIKTAFNHTIDFKKYLFINENLPDVYSSEKDNFLQDLIDNKQIEINKIIKLYEKLNDGSNKDALKNRKLKIESEIANYDSLMDKNKISKKSVDNSKILDRYNSLKYNEGTMTKALSKLIKSDKLNESLDLLIFNFYKKESELINTIKTTKSLDSMYIDCYENINNLCEIYFTFGNYSENNKVLKFSLELLQFMTKHFIIFPYIIILKKTLYAYFQSIYPNFDIDDISNRINFCFDYDFVYGGKLKKLEEHLFTIVVDKLVTNSVRKFANNQEELEFVSENISEILDNIILLFTINPIMPIPVNSKFFVNMKEINAYFDTFIPKTILNWLVIIENTYKFNINQGRIVRCIFNLTQ